MTHGHVPFPDRQIRERQNRNLHHMGKALYIAEKPSVAMEFAKALKINAGRRDGYMESDEAVIT